MISHEAKFLGSTSICVLLASLRTPHVSSIEKEFLHCGKAERLCFVKKLDSISLLLGEFSREPEFFSLISPP